MLAAGTTSTRGSCTGASAMAGCCPEADDFGRARLEGRFISCGVGAVLLDPLRTTTADADGIERFIPLEPIVVAALSRDRRITMPDHTAHS